MICDYFYRYLWRICTETITRVGDACFIMMIICDVRFVIFFFLHMICDVIFLSSVLLVKYAFFYPIMCSRVNIAMTIVKSL